MPATRKTSFTCTLCDASSAIDGIDILTRDGKPVIVVLTAPRTTA